MAETSIDGDTPTQTVISSDSNAEPAIEAQPQGSPAAAAAPQSPAPLDAGTAFRADPDQLNEDAAAASGSDGLIQQPDGSDAADSAHEDEIITWTASEFIAHHKSSSWYGLLAVIAAVIAGVVYAITRDILSTSTVVVGAILFGIVAARQPRELQYQLDGRGLQIGSRYYSYSAFRSFSVVPEGAFSSIIFMPLKRFSPLTTIYFAPDEEHRIVDLLTDSLPYEEYKHDLFDQLMRRIRF
jgi:hypothetical protein